MKRNKVFLFLFSFIFICFLIGNLMPNLKIKAETAANLNVIDASFRDTKNKGLKFTAKISDFSPTDDVKFGILLANGKTDNLDEFILDGIINGKKVLNGEVREINADNTYSVTLVKIPKDNYITNITARAYLKYDQKVVYSNHLYVSSLSDAAFISTSTKKPTLMVRDYVNSNYTLTGINNFNNQYFKKDFIETNHFNLKEEFYNDYFKLFNVDLHDLNVKEFYQALRSSNDKDLSDSTLYTFFNDDNILSKWQFFVDYCAISDINTLSNQALALSNEGVYEDYTLHNGEEMIYSIYNFLNGTSEKSIFNSLEFSDPQNYEDILSSCLIHARTSNNNYLLTGSKITLKCDEEITGYYFNGFLVNDKLYNNDDSLEIVKEDLEILKDFKEITYNVKFYEGTKEITTLPKTTYTINTLVSKLPIYTVDGYSFEGWFLDPSFKTKIESINKGTHEDTVVYVKMLEKGNRVENTYQKLVTFFNEIDIVENNLDLPLEDKENNTKIVWSSSNEDVIDNLGKLHRSYKESTITLSCNIIMGVEEFNYTFDVKVKGFKKLENIASGYIYSNYRSVTPLLFETLDIINCAFVSGLKDGSLSGYTFFNDVKDNIIDKAHERGVYVIASLAPNTEWVTIANPKNHLLDKFADNIVEMINKYHFDGIDIDWEHPKAGEFTWFTEMMKVIYKKVKANNPNHLVTAAIYGGKWQPPCYDLPHSKDYMDYINLMCYGMTNTKGYYQNALYKSPTHHDETNLMGNSQGSCSIEESVNDYVNSYGVSKSKLIPGYAFYGMVQKRELKDGYYTEWKYNSSISYTTILNTYLTNDDYVEIYDEKACVPYITNKDKTVFVSYDNPRSVKDKCKYVIDNKLGGLMYWQNGQDTTDTLLTAMKDGLHK